MIWTGWPNGGAGYGFKIKASDRDEHFDRNWSTVIVELPIASGFQEVDVNVAKASFWGTACREVISVEIGQWMMDRGDAPWVSGNPPKYRVEAQGDRRFRVITATDMKVEP